jgi:hypothetical protein
MVEAEWWWMMAVINRREFGKVYVSKNAQARVSVLKNERTKPSLSA